MLSVAPMLDWTDRHYRYFMRQITRHTLLYTEMITTGAILYGDKHRHLDFSPEEKPVAIQLGGSDPAALAECAAIAESWGYSEINLNVGCPSDRVQNGHFGACLMATPETVARAVDAMKRAVNIPVTVKHRIGIDGLERYEDLRRFVDVVAAAGTDRFIVHARIAILQGLSPKENRTVPPLQYDLVYRLKEEFPHLIIEINGGITTFEAAQSHLRYVDGVMIGRAAYENPYLFATADNIFFNSNRIPPTRRQIIETMVPYIQQMRARDIYPAHILKHMLNLFKGKPGAKHWRRFLSETMYQPGVTETVLLQAMEHIPESVLDERPEIPEEKPC